MRIFETVEQVSLLHYETVSRLDSGLFHEKVAILLNVTAIIGSSGYSIYSHKNGEFVFRSQIISSNRNRMKNVATSTN